MTPDKRALLDAFQAFLEFDDIFVATKRARRTPPDLNVLRMITNYVLHRDETVVPRDDVSSSPVVCRRPRASFQRRPRFENKEGHDRWYGEWGSGFWHQYLERERVDQHPSLRDEFEERFRVPHDVFCEFEDEMRAAGVFDQATKSRSVPPRLLLMASFKRIASGAHWPAIAECAFVSVPTLRTFFVSKFLPFFSRDEFYDAHVSHPKTEDEIRSVERAYRAVGFPGCVGSVDVVHMPWDAAPAVHSHLFYNGRKRAATYASVVTVDSNCVILHATRAGYGASNDKTLALQDDYHDALKRESVFLDFEYELLNADGNTEVSTGAYTICDGGFNTHCTAMATIPIPTAFEAAWTERLESMRKDVERCFGHMKKRFQILRLPSNVRSFEQINDTWRTCVVLHNILTRRRVSRDHDARNGLLESGAFEDQDAAVVQSWRARDVEDAEYYARSLSARSNDARGTPPGAAPDNDVALDERIARARHATRFARRLNAPSVEELTAYKERQTRLITHYNSLTKLGGVDQSLHPARRRVLREDDGTIAFVARRG